MGLFDFLSDFNLSCPTGTSQVAKGSGFVCQGQVNCFTSPCPQPAPICPDGYTMTDNGCIISAAQPQNAGTVTTTSVPTTSAPAKECPIGQIFTPAGCKMPAMIGPAGSYYSYGPCPTGYQLQGAGMSSICSPNVAPTDVANTASSTTFAPTNPIQFAPAQITFTPMVTTQPVMNLAPPTMPQMPRRAPVRRPTKKSNDNQTLIFVALGLAALALLRR